MDIWNINNTIVSVDDLKDKILPYRMQVKTLDKCLKKRLDTILPKVMREVGIDTWIVACREYNEDPVLKALVPCSMMTARRLTILVFHLEEDRVRRMALTRPGVGLDDYYEAVWIDQKNETQLACLKRILKEIDPDKIGLDYSKDSAFADGLSHTIYEELINIMEDMKTKVVSAEKLCIRYLETRLDEEIASYTGIMQIAHTLIRNALSSNVVLPGVTTSDDIKYWMIQKVIDLGLEVWFDYEVTIIRNGIGEMPSDTVVMPGDLIHLDVGLRYLGLCTDTQENAYVLKIDEEDAPLELKAAIKTVNRLQDIVVSCFKRGKTGNEILKEARQIAMSEGIQPCIYSHPIGYYGHGAGMMIGLWDHQEGVSGAGDHELYDDTAYSLELNCICKIPSWNIDLMYCAETDILFKEGKVHYLYKRQNELHLIK